MACLSYEDVRDKFIFELDDEFQTCGAFCIKFYHNGSEDIIIIDDFMPYCDKFIEDIDRFPLCRSGDD